jgi:2-dehydro-3-deoxyglucarate aldolase
MKNKLKSKLKKGKRTVGAWITIPHTDISESLSTLDFDWFVFDQEHSVLDEDISQKLMQAMKGEVTPLIRVAWNDPVIIKKALDTGTYGIIIPWVNSKNDAESAVRACKYPPEGIRGVCPRRTLILDSEYLKTVNDEILIIVQIETEEAVNNAEEILSVNGVDGFFIGPFDLSASMGIMGQIDHKRVKNAIDNVFEVGKKLGVISGIWQGAGMKVSERLNEGWQMVALGMDINFLMDGARQALQYSGI